MDRIYYYERNRQMLTFIKKIGLKYQTENSKQRRMFCLVECSGCNKQHEIQFGQLKSGYTNWCKSCGIKNQGHKK